jgi:hypothetical protein
MKTKTKNSLVCVCLHATIQKYIIKMPTSTSSESRIRLHLKMMIRTRYLPALEGMLRPLRTVVSTVLSEARKHIKHLIRNGYGPSLEAMLGPTRAMMIDEPTESEQLRRIGTKWMFGGNVQCEESRRNQAILQSVVDPRTSTMKEYTMKEYTTIKY